MPSEIPHRGIHSMGYKGKYQCTRILSNRIEYSEEAGLTPVTIERQLSRVEASKVRAAYNRAECMMERVGMMEW